MKATRSRALARFLAFQLQGWLQLRRLPWRPRWALARHLGPALWRWARESYEGEQLGLERPETCCVVLLSYRRPANLDVLLHSVLRCEFVERVIVCNNNPEVRLAGLLTAEDPRVTLLEQPRPTRQGIRLRLAAESGARFILSIDDDLFLTPEQLGLLFWRLVEAPRVPHGLSGEVARAPEAGTKYPYDIDVSRRSQEVDHLTRVYGFTDAHAREALGLAGELGLPPPEALGNGEDLLLSFAGEGRPRIHDVGPLLQCMSWNRPGIATCRTLPDFFAERVALHQRLRELRPRA